MEAQFWVGGSIDKHFLNARNYHQGKKKRELFVDVFSIGQSTYYGIYCPSPEVVHRAHIVYRLKNHLTV